MPKKIGNVPKLTHEQWLEIRRSGIGGSDASAVLGLNQLQSPFSLWMDKTGLGEEKEDSEVMRQGRDLEEYVAQRWCEETGKKVKKNNFMWRDSDAYFMLANIDREVVGEKAGLECKTTSVYNKSDFEGGEIPLTYYVQCMHYMKVMGYERMYLAVLVLGKAFYHFTIERDEQELLNLVKAEQDFWENNVRLNIAPAADGSEATKDALKKMFPGEDATEEQVILHQYDSDLEVYEILQAKIKEAEIELDGIKNRICQALGNCSYGRSSRKEISWKAQERTTLDSKRVKELYKDVFDSCCKKSTSRVLRIKNL